MACEDASEAAKWQAFLPSEHIGQPTLSRFFAGLQTLPTPEGRTDAALSDVVDSALRSLHEVSQRHKPGVHALSEGFATASRQEMLAWLLQAFDAMHYNDTLLFEAMLLLDRYYSSNPPPEDGVGGAQRKLLAAVCTALKTGAPVDNLQLTLRQVVTHLGRDQVPFDAVIWAELQMLRQLRFQVGTPTAKDFLEGLTARLGSDRIASACTSLADFLLQLTLSDIQLHYRHPHAILAASALALAFHTKSAPQSTYTALLDDLALVCPDVPNHQLLVVQCSNALHMLWLRSVNSSEQTSFTHHLCKKFSRNSLHAASAVTPPAVGLNSIPPVLGWGLQCGSGQEDFEEAVALIHQSMTSDDPRWAVTLGERLRGVAENSWKVRWVLARHCWINGRFRVAPDRDQLIRDLVRSSRDRKDKQASPKSSPPQVSKVVLRNNGECRWLPEGRVSLGSSAGSRSATSIGSTTASSSGSSLGSCSSSSSCDGSGAQRDQRRLRRAASWCGQRSVTRTACHLKNSSPGPAGHRGLRASRASSRSP